MPDSPGLLETIYTTRALRRFKPDPIPDEVLFQLFDAAIRASSGQNKQDWRWIVVTDEQGRLHGLACAHRDPARRAELESYVQSMVTFMTDAMGFFLFLGLATAFLL